MSVLVTFRMYPGGYPRTPVRIARAVGCETDKLTCSMLACITGTDRVSSRLEDASVNTAFEKSAVERGRSNETTNSSGNIVARRLAWVPLSPQYLRAVKC